VAWSDLLAGFALYLVIEGLFPFVAPRRWRAALDQLGRLEDHQLRSIGLGVVIAGLALLFVVRS
jgi:uncharacterized protein YjeT (DUF2065 family)